MKRLAGARELLDGPLDASTLAGNLRDLSRLNRWLGGQRLSWRAVEPLLRERAAGQHLRLLDVGTGAADIPRYLRRVTADLDPTLRVTATDVRPEVVEIARRAARNGDFEVKLATGDGIDERDDAYDIVHSSMLLHHLEPAAAVDMLRAMARVARVAVIVNDLDRGRLWLGWARLLSGLVTRNSYTRHDAPLSVRRAYRPSEVAAMAAKAGLRETARLWARPRYRYALVLEKS